MNFFESQDQARKKTSLLVFYFVLAVIAIILGVYGAIVGVFAMSDGPATWAGDPRLFAMVTGITLLVVVSGSLYKMAQLRSGGEAVARMLGGTLLSPQAATDTASKRLLNVVEEMALAAGVPVPPVFVLEEESINAFAAGFSSGDAVIGVTRGCLNRLNRDELQGVIGHEFSHILNGDMRLNIRLMGVLHGILVIAVIGYMLMRTAGSSSRSRSSSSKKGGNPLPLIGLALMVVGYIGVFFGKLIKSAVSRQREFLADASAVQFTRNPGGLSGALQKIGGLTAGSRLHHPRAEVASHMYFANGLAQSWFGLMATHPPLVERIRRIDPSFVSDHVDAQAAFAGAGEPELREPMLAGASAFHAPPPPPRPPPLPRTRTLAGVMESVGNPQPEHVAFAANLIAAIPTALADAARTPDGARAVVYNLLAAPEAAVRASQLERLSAGADAARLEQVIALQAELRGLAPEAHLPLIDLALPALRRMTSAEYVGFRETVRQFIDADDRVDLFEYALQRVLVRHLDPAFDRRANGPTPSRIMADVTGAATDLLSTLAYYGHDALATAQRAFATGAESLKLKGTPTMRPLNACSLEVVDKALNALEQLVPLEKQRLLWACVAVVGADGRVSVEEAELLRSVADALGCPTPPVLPPPAR